MHEQLFKLYHNERDIEGLAEELRVKQKDLERLVCSTAVLLGFVCDIAYVMCAQENTFSGLHNKNPYTVQYIMHCIFQLPNI